jgi:hypothetical protein
MRLLLSFAAVAITACAACATTAQSRRAVPRKALTCDGSMKTVETERPAYEQTAALEYLKWCGRAGAAITAQIVSASRTERDAPALENFYDIVDDWRDAQIMDAASEVARDPGATVPARVHAIKHLLRLVYSNSVYTYDRLIAGPYRATLDGQHRMPRCRVGFASELADRVGTPLRAEYEATIRRALGTLADDSTAPTPVRNAAACVEW